MQAFVIRVSCCVLKTSLMKLVDFRGEISEVSEGYRARLISQESSDNRIFRRACGKKSPFIDLSHGASWFKRWMSIEFGIITITRFS